MRFSKDQLLLLISFGIADICSAICISLQAPFYPKEAEVKGCTATEYGFVFGVHELTVFIVSPFYTKYLDLIGPNTMFTAGIFTTGTCSILFGLLDHLTSRILFISLSFFVRIVEALGNAAFLAASFSIIVKQFPDHAANIWAFLETFFGLGLIVGPTVGGALYQAGGYILPFALIGACLFTSAIFTFMILPQRDRDSTADHKRPPFKIRSVLKNPKVLVAAFSILSASVSIGFLQATLEPHLRQFGLGSIVMGLMFVLSGGVYALTAPCWGWICENWIHPKLVTAIGGFLICAAFLLIGPAPFIPLDSALWLSLLSLAIHGLGFGGQVVAAFVDAYKEAVDDGFPDNHDTNSVISGLWTSTFTLGAFIGPSMAGILMDTVGFAWGTIFVVAMHALVLIGSLIGLCLNKTKVVEDVEKRPINTSSDSGNYGSSDGSTHSSVRRDST